MALVDAAHHALHHAISICGPGVPVRCGMLRCGAVRHGIGTLLKYGESARNVLFFFSSQYAMQYARQYARQYAMQYAMQYARQNAMQYARQYAGIDP